MTDLNTAIYAGNALSPANILGNTDDVYGSGFNTILLGLFHIGRGPGAKNPIPGQQTGDIVFNNPSEGGLIVISGGAYVGPATWPQQLKQLLKVNSGKGNVIRMGCSFGGGGCEDYQTIWGNFVVNGSIGRNTPLYRNFVTLKKLFPFVDFIDFDCEEFDSSYYPKYSWTEALTAFGKMLKKIGFSLTFCPFDNNSEWMTVLKSLYVRRAPTVRWMNLQCYDGGDGNDPAKWVKAVNATKLGINGASFIVPGLWCCNTSNPDCGSTPPMMQDKFASWKKKTRALKGGFIWNYEDILANENSPDCNESYSGPKISASYRVALVRGLSS